MYLVSGKLFSQTSIDDGFDFDGISNKGYSLYIPSNYDAAVPHRLMMGFHPWNTDRWDAVSWRDTLLVFAETNGLILACPDGGADGRITDAVDTAFTTALMDSMRSWYNIDEDKIYSMGFSWGGINVYTYSLSRPTVFKGMIPVGAAVTNLTEVNSTLQANSFEMPIYIIHGSNDSPTIRFYPVRDALIAAGAFVNDTLMPGIDHTIDFPGRNALLKQAFEWIDSVNCATVVPHTGLETPSDWSFEVQQNLLSAGTEIRFELGGSVPAEVQFLLTDVSGKSKKLNYRKGQHSLATDQLLPGIYYLTIFSGATGFSQAIVIH